MALTTSLAWRQGDIAAGVYPLGDGRNDPASPWQRVLVAVTAQAPTIGAALQHAGPLLRTTPETRTLVVDDEWDRLVLSEAGHVALVLAAMPTEVPGIRTLRIAATETTRKE